jgi:hypothetical protein
VSLFEGEIKFPNIWMNLKVLILVNDFLGYIAHHLLKDVLLELVGFFSSFFSSWGVGGRGVMGQSK